LVVSSGVLSPFLKYETGSPFQFDVDAPPDPRDNKMDTYIRVPQQETMKPKPKPQPRVHFAGVVAQTHVSPVSPEGEWKPKRRDSPVSGVDLGWGHIQTGQKKAKQEPNGLGITPFWDFDGTYAPARAVKPQLPPRAVKSQLQPLSKPPLKSFTSHDAKAKYPPPLDAKTSRALKAPPAVVYRHENGAEKDGLSHFLDRTREIYHAGPKGEGQKAWSSIKRLREERKKSKQANRQQESLSNTGFKEVKTSNNVRPPPQILGKAHDKPLPGIQARSQHLKDKPYPRLPSESSRLYPASPITECGSVEATRAAQAVRQGKRNGKVNELTRQSEATIISSFRSIDLPLKASGSVHYDAALVELDMAAPGPSSFYLQPAPRLRKGSSDGSVSLREKSPSPPKVADEEARPVPRKNDAHELSRSKIGGAQALAARYANLADVQKQRSNFDREADRNESSEYISVGPFQPKGKEHKVDWLHKMGHLKIPDFPHDWTHTDRGLTRRQEKLKAKIGQPYPLTGLTGEIVNVAEESGGVGGPAAARWMPSIQLIQTAIVEVSKKGKGKQKEAPPRPEPPTEAQKPSKPWMERWAQSPNELIEGTSKFIQAHACSTSQTRGSDGSIGSFACQGVDNADLHSRPSPVHTQRSEEIVLAPADADPDLLPSPWFGLRGGANNNNGVDEGRGRTQTRNTKFYQPYGDILEQYGGEHYDEKHRF
jgi:hypothetical protein